METPVHRYVWLRYISYPRLRQVLVISSTGSGVLVIVGVTRGGNGNAGASKEGSN